MANAKFNCSLLGSGPYTVRIDLIFDGREEAEPIFRDVVNGLEETGELKICVADLVIDERRGIAANG